MPISVASPRRLAGIAAPLRALIRATLALEGLRAGEIGILLTHDAALRELNRRWRGIDRATDVLSFPYDEPPAAGRSKGRSGTLETPGGQDGRRASRGARRSQDGGAERVPRSALAPSGRGRPITGDLVISLDRMAAQARRFRQTQGRELARLVVHGALHLSGHDHHRVGERARMRAAERAALRAGAAAIARIERALRTSA